MKSMIKTVFIIIGVLTASLLMYLLLFSSTGQTFMWNAIRPAMEQQWNMSSMNNGVGRSEIYENSFKRN